MQFNSALLALIGGFSVAMAAPSLKDHPVSVAARNIEKRCLWDSCEECYLACPTNGMCFPSTAWKEFG